MENRVTKKMPPGQSEEEVAQWLLTHDTTDYVDVSKMEMPNLHRAGHVIPVSIRDDEFSQLAELAAQKKKSLAETIGLLLHRSLRDLRANPSAHL